VLEQFTSDANDMSILCNKNDEPSIKINQKPFTMINKGQLNGICRCEIKQLRLEENGCGETCRNTHP